MTVEAKQKKNVIPAHVNNGKSGSWSTIYPKWRQVNGSTFTTWLWPLTPAVSCPCSMGVVRNLLTFFHLRCCGLFKPAVIDWTQQFPPGRDLHAFGHTDMVWPLRRPSLRVKGQTLAVVLDQKHKVHLFIFLAVFAPCEERPRYSALGEERGGHKALCIIPFSCSLYRMLPYTRPVEGKSQRFYSGRGY